MTEVDFHFKAPDRLAYSCRLLRKACRVGSGVAVTGPPDLLDALDRLLWTFEETEFLPHLRLPQGEQPPHRLRPTPLWLVDEAQQAAHLPVLLNLGDEPATGFESFERLIEVVSDDLAEREAARLRWRHYAQRGYTIRPHEVAG